MANKSGWTLGAEVKKGKKAALHLALLKASALRPLLFAFRVDLVRVFKAMHVV